MNDTIETDKKVKFFSSGTAYISITKDEAERLGIKNGDWVKTTIRKIEESDV